MKPVLTLGVESPNDHRRCIVVASLPLDSPPGKLVLLMEDNAPVPGPSLGARPGRETTGKWPVDRPLAMGAHVRVH